VRHEDRRAGGRELVATLRHRDELAVDRRDDDVHRPLAADLEQRIGERRIIAAGKQKTMLGVDEEEARSVGVDVRGDELQRLVPQGSHERVPGGAPGACDQDPRVAPVTSRHGDRPLP
jgi:hypothetical protein